MKPQASDLIREDRVLGGPAVAQCPSVEEWVLAQLTERGAQSLDQLGGSLPEMNWAQLFLAVDRLSRCGLVSLRPARQGDYLVSMNRGPVSIPTDH